MSDGIDRRQRRKLTDDVLDRIFEARANGATWAGACAAEGVSREALRRLALRDPEVAARLEQADGKGAEWYRHRIIDALSDDSAERIKSWSGWAWLAERSHPAAFPRQAQRVEQTLALKRPDEMSAEEAYAELVLAGTLARGSNPEMEAAATASGLLPIDVEPVDGGDE